MSILEPNEQDNEPNAMTWREARAMGIEGAAPEVERSADDWTD